MNLNALSLSERYDMLHHNPWTRAIKYIADKYYLPANVAAEFLSPNWEQGKSMGLSEPQVFDYAVPKIDEQLSGGITYSNPTDHYRQEYYQH